MAKEYALPDANGRCPPGYSLTGSGNEIWCEREVAETGFNEGGPDIVGTSGAPTAPELPSQEPEIARLPLPPTGATQPPEQAEEDVVGSEAWQIKNGKGTVTILDSDDEGNPLVTATVLRVFVKDGLIYHTVRTYDKVNKEATSSTEVFGNAPEEKKESEELDYQRTGNFDWEPSKSGETEFEYELWTAIDKKGNLVEDWRPTRKSRPATKAAVEVPPQAFQTVNVGGIDTEVVKTLSPGAKVRKDDGMIMVWRDGQWEETGDYDDETVAKLELEKVKAEEKKGLNARGNVVTEKPTGRYDDYGYEIIEVVENEPSGREVKRSTKQGTYNAAKDIAYQAEQVRLRQDRADQEAWRLWQQGQATAQLETDRQARLANLKAQPISWLEYSLANKSQPAYQPWMFGLLPKPIAAQAQAGVTPLPVDFTKGAEVADLTKLPELTTPSTQYQARMGPTGFQQFLGYERARTGAPAEEIDWKLWNQAPPGGRNKLLTRTR